MDERDEPSGWLSVASGFDAIGRPYPAAYARFRAAAATLRDRGARADAQVALAEARATATRLDAKPLLTEIDLLARQGRLEIEPRQGPGEPDRPDVAGLGLTEREREVLRLIAAGWSNQEIADTLFISRKTASVHASNIFDKLGATNRNEAAAIAHRLGLSGDAPPPPRTEA